MKYPKNLLEPPLLPYAIAVGTLCNAWANLEGAIRMLFLQISRMPHDRTSFGIAHILDVREQIAAIKLAFVAKSGNAKLVDAVHSIMNYIDNVLRPWRNRFVHDPWYYSDQIGAVERFSRTPRVFRPQAHQPREWTPLEISENELSLIWKTVRDIREYQRVLYDLQDCFRDKQRAISKLLRSPPKQRLQARATTSKTLRQKRSTKS
jgi:hypothetical protein